MKSILIIVQRNFGDAILLNSCLKSVDIDKDVNISILTKSSYKTIFESNSNIRDVYIADIPMITCKKYDFLNQYKVIKAIRNRKFDIVLDYIGDFRERCLGSILNGRRLVTVRRGNNFSKLVRDEFAWLANEVINVDSEYKDVYRQTIFILNSIGIDSKIDNVKPTIHKVSTVGIHPFASRECRMWDWKKWKVLIKRLLDKDINVYIFGSQSEEKILIDHFGNIHSDKLIIFANTLELFLAKLTEMDLLIGLDSFSLHAAYSCGVNNIMICGANDHELWRNPLCDVVVLGKKGCSYWPCYNLPICNGSYSCIQNITVDDVLCKVMDLEV